MCHFLLHFQLNYVYPILERESPALYDFLEASEVGTIFALPWLITWFGHVLPDYEDVVRLYDFFLARPPLMPVYLAAALVLHREQEVLLCECDMAMVSCFSPWLPYYQEYLAKETNANLVSFSGTRPTEQNS